MAARFWVGGTGNWDASTTTNWAATSNGAGGATVPGTSDDVTFDASSGGGTVTVTATQAVITITSGAHTGTLDTNGQTITTTGTFSITGSATRTVTLGASVINCVGWAATTVTNLTLNVNTSSIRLTGTGTFAGGARTYNEVQLNGTAHVVSGINTFATLTRTGSAAKGDTLTFNAAQTVTGTLTLTGNSAINRLFVRSDVIGTSRTITAATVTVDKVDFRDITGAGAATWDMSAATGYSGDAGGNSMKALGSLAFTTAALQTAIGTASFTWSTHGWTSRVPLPQDDVSIPNAFVAGRTATGDMPRLGKSITFSCTGSPTFNISLGASLFGSLDLTGIATFAATSNTLTFEGRSAFTLTSAGINIDRPITLSAPTGTLKLMDNVAEGAATSRAFSLSSGTLDLNGKTITNFGTFVVGTGSLTRAIVDTAGNGTIDLTLATATSVWQFSGSNFTTSNTWTIKISGSTTNIRTFVGGSATYSKLWFSNATTAGQLTITGVNTFNDIKAGAEGNAQTIIFDAAKTTTVTTFTVSGASGNLITINSDTTGTHALTKAGGGTISCDFLDIQHSVARPWSGASGADTWFAGANSTNNQGVATAGSGWIFTAPPGSGKFFQMF